MGVCILPAAVTLNFNVDGTPIWRAGGWPIGVPPPQQNIDAFYIAVSTQVPGLCKFTCRAFLPGTTINLNSIAVQVQPLGGTFMPFLINPLIQGTGNVVNLQFGVGANPGEVDGALHQVTVQCADDQGTQGTLQFYYIKMPAPP